MTSFGWLHLTDLHCGGPEYGWFWPRLEERFFDDLAALHTQSGPWDFVFFTGDLVQSGTESQFRQVSSLLDRILGRIRALGSRPTLLAVPGNHDLERPDAADPELLGLVSWAKSPDLRRDFWLNPGSQLRSTVARSLSNYDAWSKNYTEFGDKGIHWGQLPGDFSYTLEKEGAKLGILGLNTTALQLAAGDYKGRLAVHVSQFHSACPSDDGPKWASDHHACLLLTHQPPDWLDSESLHHLNGEIATPGQFSAHLFGHMHEASYSTRSDGGSDERLFWQGRSLFGLDTYADGGLQKNRLHGYSAGRISIEDSNTASLTFWPREARRTQDGTLHVVADLSYSLPDGNATAKRKVRLIREFTGKLSALSHNIGRKKDSELNNHRAATTVVSKITDAEVKHNIEISGFVGMVPTVESLSPSIHVEATMENVKAQSISVTGSKQSDSRK